MRDLDASAFDTHDCSVAGCPGEARERGGLCRYHQTTSDRPLPVEPGSHAHLMKEPHVNTCKVESCSNPSAGKGGWCVGLCDDHISIEGTRRQAVRRERLRAEKTPKTKALKPPPVDGQPKQTPAAPVAAKPLVQAAPERSPDGRPLVQLAQYVEDAAADLEAARSRHTNAIAALRLALDEAA